MRSAILLLFSAVSFFAACEKKNPVPNQQASPKKNPPVSKVHLLKVDYLTTTFEGGADIQLSTPTLISDTLPVKINFVSPSDFGWVSLQFAPTGDTLFSGGIIWMGKGSISFPGTFMPVSSFAKVNPGAQPQSADYVPIDLYAPEHGQLPDLSKSWAAIGNLKVVQDHLSGKRKISVFLYTPSVGIGNPADWDWIFFVCN